MCAAKMGLSIAHSKLAAVKGKNNTIEEQLNAFGSRGRCEFVALSDPSDVAAIRKWKEKRDQRRIDCNMVVIRDGVVYYAQSGQAAPVVEWERLFSSIDPLQCIVCRMEVRTSRKMVACEQCHARICDGCSWRIPTSECSFCGTFDMSAYMKKRARCAQLIFAHHGFTPSQIDTFKAGNSVCVLRDGGGDKTLDKYIDEILVALGDKVYFVREEVHAYIE